MSASQHAAAPPLSAGGSLAARRGLGYADEATAHGAINNGMIEKIARGRVAVQASRQLSAEVHARRLDARNASGQPVMTRCTRPPDRRR